MLAEFHWLRPEWLLAIPAVLIAAGLLLRGRLSAGNWQAVIDPQLLPYVLSRAPGRGIDHRWWLFAVAGILAALALAGPAWQRIEQPVFRVEQSLVIALDLSRSMDAQDLTPSRLVRAKLKILDMLARRQSGQTALIVYSANAFTVTPLTTDTDTIAALVNSLSTDIMPSRGSYPEIAIHKSRQLLDQAGASFGEVLLITDGGSSPAATEQAKALTAVGYSLSVLGVGTTEGAPIPRLSGGFVTDNRGKIAVPRLELSALKALAASGGGRFAQLSADDRDLDVLLSGEINGGGRIASDASLLTDRWREQGPWLVLLLLPLAALAFRRGWVLVALLVVVPLTPIGQPVEAASWSQLWLNDDQRASRLLQEGKHEEAADLFERNDWQAVARYRAEDYAESARQLSGSDIATNLYNLGNAKALQGELDASIAAYERALALTPGDDDTQYNLELVRNLKKQQEQQQQEQAADQSSSEGEGEGEDSAGDGDAESEAPEGDPESQSPSDESDSSQSDTEAMSEDDMRAMQEELQRAAEEAQGREQPEQLSAEELAELRQQQEKQQAMEQWLRRIPDDPGGLLRSKFRYLYQRKGQDQDGNSVWPDNEVQPW
jgi:Ca-activated chloride channel family protein